MRRSTLEIERDAAKVASAGFRALILSVAHTAQNPDWRLIMSSMYFCNLVKSTTYKITIPESVPSAGNHHIWWFGFGFLTPLFRLSLTEGQHPMLARQGWAEAFSLQRLLSSPQQPKPD